MLANDTDKDKRIEDLKKEVKDLNATITKLNKQLSKYETPKNSSNSSLPPSHDLVRPLRTKSLREPSGSKPGWQPGHQGKTLQMAEKPDQIIEHSPSVCTCCGLDLSHIQAAFVERRQEVVLPVVKPIFVEHQVFRRTCTCGHTDTSGFPPGVTSGISYGQNVECLAAYMNVRQYVPYRRLAEMFHHVFHLFISEGALVSAVDRVAQRCIPTYKLIHEVAKTSKANGCDETGMTLNGAKCGSGPFKANCSHIS